MSDKPDLNALARHMNDLTGDPLPGVSWQECAVEIITVVRQRDALLEAMSEVLLEAAKAGTMVDLNRNIGTDPELYRIVYNREKALRAAIKACESD